MLLCRLERELVAAWIALVLGAKNVKPWSCVFKMSKKAAEPDWLAGS